MSTITVVNVKRLRTPEHRAAVVYCGRAFAGWPESPWANPFPLRDFAGDRAACLAAFRLWFTNHADRDRLLDELWAATEGGVKPLGCWCKPAACHCDVLAELLRERLTSRGAA
jgi:hypothetical protein